MGRKPKPNLPAGGNWLLPPADKVAPLLGLPQSLKQGLKLMSESSDSAQEGPALPLDSTTLRKGPVEMPRGSRLKLWRWVRRQMTRLRSTDFQALLRQLRPLMASSTSTLPWRACALGLNASGRQAYPRTLAYILERCDQEDQLVAAVRAAEDSQRAAERLREGLHRHTHIPEAALGVGLDQLLEIAFAAQDTPAAPRLALTPDLARTLLWIYYEPWIHLASIAEAEWRRQHSASFLLALTIEDGGILGQLWPTWDQDTKKLVRPPERFFVLLRQLASQRRGLAGPMSWNTFASNLPDPEQSSRLASEDADPENKTRQLREWRKNGRRPTDEGFETLLRNLGTPDDWVPTWRFLLRLVYGLDETLRTDLKSVPEWPVDPEPIFAEIFARYPRYLATALNPGHPMGAPGGSSCDRATG